MHLCPAFIRKFEDTLEQRKPIAWRPIDILRVIRESRREYL